MKRQRRQHGAEGGEGAWSTASGGYTGTCTVAGGKRHIAIADCIDYFIAPRGTWELLPVSTNVPSGFTAAVDGNMLHWTPPPGVAMTFVYVLDPELAKSGAPRGVPWQTLLIGPGKRAADLRLAHMKPGRTLRRRGEPGRRIGPARGLREQDDRGALTRHARPRSPADPRSRCHAAGVRS